MKPPAEFLKIGFPLKAQVWCEREGRINRHELVIVESTEKHIRFWKTCLDCEIRHARLSKLGVDCDDPRKADVMPTTEWVFLCLHPEDIIA